MLQMILGKIINPLLVAGQVHGGIVQGLGQAMCEHAIYEEETGQLMNGSYMDYQMPRADDFPHFNIDFNEEAECTTNLLGAKGWRSRNRCFNNCICKCNN